MMPETSNNAARFKATEKWNVPELIQLSVMSCGLLHIPTVF